MATTFHASTPPPPSSIHTPSTPRFGFDDNYEPYSPRKSTRVAQRSRNAETPPPPSRKIRATQTPRSSKRVASTSSMMDTPTSPPTASKKRMPKTSLPPTEVGGRRVSGALTYDTTVSAAASLGLPAPKNKKEAPRSIVAPRSGLLPTPAKTPKKRPDEIAPAVTSIARNLFAIRPSTDEAMPSPKKSKKKYTGLTLDSFMAEESASIEIYTDSTDRVPEADLSPNNPFYGGGARNPSEPTKRSVKRRKMNVPGEGMQDVEELEHREDGMVYTFRGKKVFKKFADIDAATGDQDEEDEEEIGGDISRQLARPLTRSSIKPRLLFPTPEQKIKNTTFHNTTDEEADTDIEERGLHTPLDNTSDITTPKAPRFAPASPPTTLRTTRSKKVDMSSSPAAPTSDDESITTSPKRRISRGKVSPFDQWQRVRGPAATAGGSKKREGEPLTRAVEKKSRG